MDFLCYLFQSTVETMWLELPRVLAELVDRKTFCNDAIDWMDWQTKC